MSDDQYGQIIRWFEKLSASVSRLETSVNELRSEVHDTRELMAHLQDDDRVQREAIAGLSRRIEAVETSAA